ncbi:hypothetical protein TCAL_16874 [Tigriopus californicus]|uniref:Uncharacterized protein n=1 Tax=Tigriopus californicus TaxID=6832 RepID=A0A553PBX2_TIGCA|nr:hypothetical protein TCAL_16874 [Tigriopus californicus]
MHSLALKVQPLGWLFLGIGLDEKTSRFNESDQSTLLSNHFGGSLKRVICHGSDPDYVTLALDFVMMSQRRCTAPPKGLVRSMGHLLTRRIFRDIHLRQVFRGRKPASEGKIFPRDLSLKRIISQQ